MAVSSIAVPPDPARDARALSLVDQVGSWPKHTLKVAWGAFEAGTVFRRAVGSNGKRYLVNAVACECPDYQQSANICKHIRALVLFEQQAPTVAPAPTRRASYEELFPACPCGDIAEAKDGLCDRCASEREYEQRMESSRASVARGPLKEAWL
jgi:hypothetical protein